MSFPVRSDVPAITTEQMREVDRIMIEDLHVGLIQMMENAGRALATLVHERFRPASVTVLAGPGGNGGGGIAAARHLANRGIAVSITASRALEDFGEASRHQATIASHLGIDLAAEPHPAEVLIDALVGYSISGDPRERTAELIEWANSRSAPVVALDVPSGLDPSTGVAGAPTIAAAATLTLALPKIGLAQRPELVGELYLADISVPPSVYEAFGIVLEDPFGDGPVVRLT